MSDFLDSFPNVSSSHCFSESSNGRACALRTSRRSSAGWPRISFSMAYSAAMRSIASAATGDLMRDVQVVELSAHMRPAGRFLNAPGFVHRIESRVAIGLQRAREIAEVRLRMLALAIRRVGEPHRRRCCVSRGAVIAHIGPQPPGFCFSISRRQHRNRRVVGVQLRRAQHVTPQRFHQRRKQLRSCRPPSPPASSVPAPRLRARKSPTGDTAASDRNISRPARAPAVPGPATPRSIGRLGASACTIRSQHAQASFGRTCRITLNRAGTYSRISETSSPRCFSSPPQSGQASCFGGYFRTSRGRCSGSGLPRWFRRDVCNGRNPCRCVRSSCVLRLRRLQLVQPQLQLLDLTIQLLRLAPELHPPQLGDQQLQMLDLVVARKQLFVFRQQLCALREDESFEFVGIECVEIGESVMRGNHCRESSRLLLQQN